MRGITSLATTSDGVPRYDDSNWPLFAIEMPPQRMSPATFDAHLAMCSSVYERRTPFVMLIDMADHPSLLASQRSALSDAMRIDSQRHPGLCRAVAVVVRSSFERSIAQSIHAMSNAAYPVRFFASTEEARAWLATHARTDSSPPSQLTRELASLPSRRPLSSAPPFSQRVREAPAPVSARPREAMLPPSRGRCETAAPSSRRPRESSLPLSRRSRELG
ncbi:MAG TPA: STAS/SEC14 domain-containing protein [Polyangiaceae bacterium]|nr:STAS/SEC14 domain-containing protein [Polyangiaceae bacterium]